MKNINIIIATFGGVLAAYLKAYLPLIVIVAIAVILDFITGIIAAVYTGDGLNSKKARKGALKKATMFLSLAFGIFLDYLIPMAAIQIGFDISTNLMFSSIIAFYITFTECVSVCENIYRCNPDSFPKWIVKVLTEGKEKLEHINDSESEDKKE